MLEKRLKELERQHNGLIYDLVADLTIVHDRISALEKKLESLKKGVINNEKSSRKSARSTRRIKKVRKVRN